MFTVWVEKTSPSMPTVSPGRGCCSQAALRTVNPGGC